MTSGIVAVIDRSVSPDRRDAERLVAAMPRRACGAVQTAPGIAFAAPLVETDGKTWLLADIRFLAAPPPSLLDAWNSEGERLFERLRGSWAVVVWDTRQWTAARDAFGSRPLFVAEAGRTLIASEVGPLLASPGVDGTLEPRAIRDYLADDWRSDTYTFHRGVQRVRAGHVARDGVQRRWFLPPADVERVTRGEAATEVRRLLGESVAARLPDGPVLVELSGGLDSSSVAAIAVGLARDRDRPLPTLVSAIHPGQASDESEWIDRVARRLRVDPVRIDNRGEAIELPPDRPWPSAGLPISPFVRGEVDLAARLGASVVLTGHAGDEVFFEGGAFRDLAARGRFVRLLRETLVRGYTARPRGHYLVDAIKGNLRRTRRIPAAPSWAGPVLAQVWHEPEEPEFPYLSHDRRMLWRWTTGADAVLAIERTEALDAGRGIEHRHPYLDEALLGFVLRVPLDVRLPGGRHKRLLRDAMAADLPHDLVHRREVVVGDAEIDAFARRAIATLRPTLGGEWLSEPYVQRSAMEGLLDAKGDWQAAALALRVARLERWLRAT